MLRGWRSPIETVGDDPANQSDRSGLIVSYPWAIGETTEPKPLLPRSVGLINDGRIDAPLREFAKYGQYTPRCLSCWHRAAQEVPTAAEADDIMTIEQLTTYLKILQSPLYKSASGWQGSGAEGWQTLAVPQADHRPVVG